FSAIYVFNLRGNARTQGEQRQREKGNVFGSGSRAPIAITILVKNPAQFGKADIFYKDIGDYLTREQKLDAVKNLGSVLSDEFKPLTPNDKGDWLNQRGNAFDTFIPLASDEKFDGAAQSFFVVNFIGISTNRDTWVYNFSQSKLEKNIRTTIDYYNLHEPTDFDATKFVWTDLSKSNKNRGLKYEFDASKIVLGMYRPFCKQNLYYDKNLNERRSQMPKIFPNGHEENLLICVNGNGDKDFSVFITDKITDLHFNGDTQCHPLYWYEEARQGGLFGTELSRRDGVSDWIMRNAQFVMRNDKITKEDIFYYVYGFLHLPAYREKFSAELKKSLPRIILVDDAEKFWSLSCAGRELAELHLNYETQEPPAEVQLEMRNAQCGMETYRVNKMKLSKDKTTLYYNEYITIKNIPVEASVWRVNGRSALEWIVDRYQIKKDPASGILNDPNAWAVEHGNPRYILDLILSSITVSLKTLDIIESLPEVDFGA
ncbi:MAG: hypothetical protein IKT98_05985, partial [Selenomonadaceae bacterium]|nr:hypothetical protein [Selenomonadaceae bacterium]